MNTPINVQDIWEFAPHRPPMVWVDQVLSFGANGGACSVSLKGDAHYMTGEGLRPSSCLEFIAQSYGFISICHRNFNGQPVNQVPKRAFLASFKDADFCDENVMKSVRAGDLLTIYISGTRQMGPIILFQGQVRRGDEVLCESSMKVFSE